MQIRWHGHAFFSLLTREGKLVLIDPFVENGMTRRRVEDFRPDLVLVTHAHDDHVGSTLDFDAPVVAGHELAGLLAKRGARAQGMGIGGFYRAAGVRVWCAPAMHSSGFDDGEGGFLYGGSPTGFVVDDGETRFYHAGDTGLFGDMRHVIRDMLQPHVAAVPIGDHYTMDPEHAARAVEWLGVGVALPMHYGTFDVLVGDPHDFAARVGSAAEVVVPEVDGGVEVKGGRVVRRLSGAEPAAPARREA